MENGLTENQQKFKELYIQQVLLSGGAMGEELNALFDLVLMELDDDPERMGTFIQQIKDEVMPPVPSETEILQKQVAQMAFKLMQLEGGM